MVSGGSDSVALARIMCALYPQLPLAVLHVNHGLRGKDADTDELFVSQLSRQLKLPFHSVHVDVAALTAARGAAANAEDVGRQERYAAANNLLAQLCANAGCDVRDGRIVTAHTLDDRVETFLMRLVVGAGSAGLASIPPVNGNVVRPLLSCTREQLRTYIYTVADVQETKCHPALDAGSSQATSVNGSDGGWTYDGTTAPLWREDATNADTSRLRAFVRHEVVTLLTSKNPDFLRTMERTIDVLCEEDAYLREEASMLVNNAEQDGPLTLDAATLRCPHALARRIAYEACNRAIAVLAPGARITQEHVDAIVQRGAQSGFAIHLPGGIEVRNESGLLTFAKAAPPRKYH
jgi:tRNA(Ile)-lysidine synthase